MNVVDFLKPELAILIPVLYALGAWFKEARQDHWKIPFVLSGAGVVLSLLYLLATIQLNGFRDVALLIFMALTQGIVATSVAVFGNQVWKQVTVGREEDTMYLHKDGHEEED